MEVPVDQFVVASCPERDAPYKPGVVNSGQFVTAADCKFAASALLRLVDKRKKFENQLKQLQAWSNKGNVDVAEFEKLRNEAEADLAWEFIDHLPVLPTLDILKENPALKGVDIDKVKAGYEAMKGLLETGKGVADASAGKPDPETLDRILTGEIELQKAMMDAAHLDESSARLLEACTKSLQVGEKAAVLAAKSNERKLTAADWGEFAVDVAAKYTPWTAAAAEGGQFVVGEALNGGQIYYANKALNSLQEAQSRNWDARRYYATRIDDLTYNIQAGADDAVEVRTIRPLKVALPRSDYVLWNYQNLAKSFYTPYVSL